MVDFCGIIFNHPIINASGCWVSTDLQIDNLLNSKLAGITLKTLTLHQKNPNSELNYYKTNTVVFNCMGCPNYGYTYYKNIVSNIKNKPIILSVLETLDDNDELSIILNDYNKLNQHKKLVEINLSCPNLENRIIGYHTKDIEKVINKLRLININNLIIGFKLPPYFEIYKINKITELLNKNNDIIKFITCSNTIPHGLILKNQEFVLSNKFGGISGKLNKYIATSNIFNFKTNLINIQIIGCGGISDIDDVKDYLTVGANLVQIGSAFYDNKYNNLDINKINELIEK